MRKLPSTWSRAGLSTVIFCFVFQSSASAADPGPVLRSGYQNGFVVSDEEGVYVARLNVFGQMRYTGSSSPALTNQTFDLALGRVAISGTAFDPRLTYFVQAETSTLGNNNAMHLLDAWLGWGFDEHLSVTMGRMLVPYSRQFYTHPGQLLFADLSAADYAFNLPRSSGVQTAGKTGRIGYHFAALNSIRALDGQGEHNAGNALAVVARMEVDILQPYGYIESLPNTPHRPQFSIGLAAASNPVAAASAFQNVSPGDRTKNFTTDAGFRWSRLSLQAAGYLRQSHFSLDSHRAEDWGTYAQTGFYLVPTKWEIAARYSGVRFGGPATILGREINEYTAGLNRYFFEHHFKLQSDYSRITGDSAGTDHRVRFQVQLFL